MYELERESVCVEEGEVERKFQKRVDTGRWNLDEACRIREKERERGREREREGKVVDRGLGYEVSRAQSETDKECRVVVIVCGKKVQYGFVVEGFGREDCGNSETEEEPSSRE